SLSRTSNFSSKSLYWRLLHRNVLNLRPLDAAPTRAPSLMDQYSVRPSQPSRFLPLKKTFLSSPARVALPPHKARTANAVRKPKRMRIIFSRRTTWPTQAAPDQERPSALTFEQM